MLRRGIIHTGKVGIKMKVKPNVCLTFVWWTKIFVRIFGFTVTTTRTHDESSRVEEEATEEYIEIIGGRRRQSSVPKWQSLDG